MVSFRNNRFVCDRQTLQDVILVQAASRAAMPIVQQEIADLLLQRHHLQGSDSRDFIVPSQEDVAQEATTTARVMGALLAGVAAVSLILGGIGIMNINGQGPFMCSETPWSCARAWMKSNIKTTGVFRPRLAAEKALSMLRHDARSS